VIEAVVLIPEAGNTGDTYSPRLWRRLEDRLIARFGGFSVAGNVCGAWRSQERLYTDVSRQYVVALASWWHLPAWPQLVDWARTTFRQEALYVKVAGIPEVRGAP
jgi:hypothetical protein